jgi:hypothetical protein
MKTPPVSLPFMEAHINRQGFDQAPLHKATHFDSDYRMPQNAGIIAIAGHWTPDIRSN